MLAAQPRLVGAELARSTDDVDHWVLVLRFGSVGDYRAVMGSVDVKTHVVPVLAHALDEPTVHEVLRGVGDRPGSWRSGRAEDADTFGLGGHSR